MLHTFSVVVQNDGRFEAAERALLDGARAEMAPYAEEAHRFFERMSKERHIEIPTQEPRVLVQIDAPRSLKLICRLPTPTRRKGRIEQAILRRYLRAVPPPSMSMADMAAPTTEA